MGQRLTVVLLCAAGLSTAATLPEGAGKAETTKICSKCHSLEQAVSLRQDQAGWTESISKMVNLGAQGSDEDFNKVLNYLVKFYGVGGAATGAGAAAPGAAASATSPSVESAGKTARAMNAKDVTLPVGGTPVDAAKEWRTYGHDAGGMRFSPLTQIKPENVSQLKVAWVYHMRPPGFKPAADARGGSAPPERSRWRRSRTRGRRR